MADDPPVSIISIVITDKPDGGKDTVVARNIMTRRHAAIAIELINDTLLHQLDLDSWNLKERTP